MYVRDLLLRYAEQRDAERSTIDWLRLILRRFEAHLGRQARIADLNDDAVNKWTNGMIDAALIARRTIHGYRRGLLILWRFAIDQGIVDSPPCRLRRIKLPKLIPSAWEQTKAAELLPHAAKLTGKYKQQTQKSVFWTALILAIWDAGLRLGDCLKLRWSDFNASGVGCLRQNKTSWPKPFRLSPAALEAMEALRRPGNDLVFGKIVSRRTIYKTMGKLTSAAGLVGGTKKLRKSGATAVEKISRGSATPYLGHKTQQMAYDFYVDPTLLDDNIKSPPPLIEKSTIKPPEAA